MIPNLEEQGALLKRWRLEMGGLTSAEAATRCGVTLRTWQMWEANATKPPASLWFALAALLIGMEPYSADQKTADKRGSTDQHCDP